MSLSALVVGIDPGPIPGVVALCVGGGCPVSPSIFQCDAGSVGWLVRETLSSRLPWDRRILAIERFVVGPRAARSSTPAAGRLTRDMVGELIALGLELPGVQVIQRSASEVMTWATDVRLDRAGLLAATKGMTHARAAAKQAIYAAVADCGAPDPLSKTARAS
jgi:hypothetical protein